VEAGLDAGLPGALLEVDPQGLGEIVEHGVHLRRQIDQRLDAHGAAHVGDEGPLQDRRVDDVDAVHHRSQPPAEVERDAEGAVGIDGPVDPDREMAEHVSSPGKSTALRNRRRPSGRR
jgi:hypothetical protein